MNFVMNSSEMKAIDEYTISMIGIPQEVLMERAAYEVAAVMKQHINKEDHILVVCGTGNNGGDGIATGRILCLQGYHVALLFIGKESKSSHGFQKQLQIARNLGIPVEHSNRLSEYNVVIDAIFGVGLSRPVTGEYEETIRRINKLKPLVFSVDIPSGISADDGRIMNVAIRANYTITFGYQKIGLLLYPGADYAGEIHVVDIGFALLAENVMKTNMVYFNKEDLSLLPSRNPYSNKATFGKVLVIGGSKGVSGAVYLSAMAAYRTGAGMVKILTAQDNRVILQTGVPEALFRAYDDTSVDNELRKNHIIQDLKWADVVVFGPGIGVSQAARELLALVLENCNTTLILDADGINLISQTLNQLQKEYDGEVEQRDDNEKHLDENNLYQRRQKQLSELLVGDIILTPHILELSRLLDHPVSYIVNNLVDTAFQCSYNSNLIYAIKDARTIVTHSKQRYINISGNQGMATAGSGDVLSGVIAALIGQGMSSYDATCLGVYIHGLAGDEAAKNKGSRSMMATDIIDHIEVVLHQTEKNSNKTNEI